MYKNDIEYTVLRREDKWKQGQLGSEVAQQEWSNNI